MNNTKDLHIFESGNGGDIAVINGDIALSETLYQTVYIALFGGNTAANTLGNEIENEERFDYWANSLIFKNNKNKQFNSNTERSLNNNPLNSSGRLAILSAVNEDLSFIKNSAELSTNVFILSESKVSIKIKIENTSNQPNSVFQFIWDNAKKELIIDKTI